MIKKHFTQLLIAVSLIFSSTAYANIIATETTFNWAADCSDCNSQLGVIGDNSVSVSGSIVLNNYTLGTEFTNDTITSFSYDGPSIHIDAFTWLNDGSNEIYDGSGWIAEDLSSYWINFKHDFLAPFVLTDAEGNILFDEEGRVIETGTYVPATAEITYLESGDWSIDYSYDLSEFNQAYDFGGGASIALASNTSVPEPSTLAIFALACFGLVSCKFKKKL